jgi:hypothetical protein
VADNNNREAGNLPKAPNPALRELDRLVGKWRVSGGYKGIDVFEWMEGGFFFVHRFDGTTPYGRLVKGVEYVGFDGDTQTLRSHLIGIDGSNFTYTWEVEGDDWTIWFGDRGSDNFFRGKFDRDGNTVTGRWQWREGDGRTGGFEFTSTRITEPNPKRSGR